MRVMKTLILSTFPKSNKRTNKTSMFLLKMMENSSYKLMKVISLEQWSLGWEQLNSLRAVAITEEAVKLQMLSYNFNMHMDIGPKIAETIWYICHRTRLLTIQQDLEWLWIPQQIQDSKHFSIFIQMTSYLCVGITKKTTFLQGKWVRNRSFISGIRGVKWFIGIEEWLKEFQH